MAISVTSILFLSLLFFVVAMFYSSVGFGGGSSYLSIFALVAVSFFMMRSLALVCNIIVVSGSTYWYIKKGYFKISDFLPFIFSSIPMAFIGASFELSEQVFFIILGVVLILASMFLIWQVTPHAKTTAVKTIHYSPIFNYAIGASIGLVSGLVGIGGGIFLAPILYYFKWGTSLKIAALSSFFILVNSISGLGGLIFSNTFEAPLWIIVFLGLAVFLGGQVGVRLSFIKLSPKGIKLVTAILIFIVGLRVMLIQGLNMF